MKVLHFIDSLGGSGGAEQGMVREITRFSGDVDQLMVRLFATDDLSPMVVDAGIRDHWLGLTDHSAKHAYPHGIRRLVTLIRKERPGVVHTSLFAANLIGQVAGRITRTPVLSTFTLSGDPALLRAHQPGGASRKAEFLRTLGGVAARGKRIYFQSLTTDAAVANAELLKIDSDRVTTIPRGVPSDLRPDPLIARSDLGVPDDARLIINVGREVAQKGQVHLLNTFAKLRTVHPDLHLVICGRPGETSDELTELTSQLGLEGHITRYGYTPHVHHLAAHATIFAFPSLMKGLGTALLEAMSVRTPIVGRHPARSRSGRLGRSDPRSTRRRG
jgi:glycosyltransferase involved in cell wall biosynthesis